MPLNRPARAVICGVLLAAAAFAPLVVIRWAAADVHGWQAHTAVTVKGTTAASFPAGKLGKAPDAPKTATQPAVPQPVQPPKQDPPKQDKGGPGSATSSTTPAATSSTKTATPTKTATATTSPDPDPTGQPSS